MLRLSESRPPEAVPGVIEDVRTYFRDTLVIAKYSVWIFSRYRSWFLNLAIGPFLAIAPFVFLADTLVGRGNALT